MTVYPLHEAVLQGSIQNAARLITRRAELNVLNDKGQTALHWAVFRGDYEIVKQLLELGADPNFYSEDGVTPCWRTATSG